MKTVYWLENKQRSQSVLRFMPHDDEGLISRHLNQNNQGVTLMMNKLIYRQYQSGIHLPFTVFFLALAVFGISSSAAAADPEGQAQSAAAVARELANPNSSLATLTLKNQYRWYTGDLPGADDQDNFTMVFQPVFPLSMPKDDNGNARTVFFRPGFPMLFDQPVPRVENGALDWDGISALGDIGFDIGYGVSETSGFLWAVGMVGTLPTATDDDVGGKQLRLGPEFLLAKFEKWGLYGIFPSHQWNVTGWSDESFSTTQFQPVLKFLLGDGWTAGSSPIGNYNWESSEWTIPINLSVSKTVLLGETPWKFELETNYYVEQPDAFGPQWMIGFNISPVVNNPFQKGFNRLIGVK